MEPKPLKFQLAGTLVSRKIKERREPIFRFSSFASVLLGKRYIEVLLRKITSFGTLNTPIHNEKGKLTSVDRIGYIETDTVRYVTSRFVIRDLQQIVGKSGYETTHKEPAVFVIDGKELSVFNWDMIIKGNPENINKTKTIK